MQRKEKERNKERSSFIKTILLSVRVPLYGDCVLLTDSSQKFVDSKLMPTGIFLYHNANFYEQQKICTVT